MAVTEISVLWWLCPLRANQATVEIKTGYLLTLTFVLRNSCFKIVLGGLEGRKLT
jgi:hypothetical protein